METNTPIKQKKKTKKKQRRIQGKEDRRQKCLETKCFPMADGLSSLTVKTCEWGQKPKEAGAWQESDISS